jgi:hypothetical protein
MSDTLVAILIIVIVVGVCLGLFFVTEWITCLQQTVNIGHPHRFLIPAGTCQVQENGYWIPLENWRWFGD